MEIIICQFCGYHQTIEQIFPKLNEYLTHLQRESSLIYLGQFFTLQPHKFALLLYVRKPPLLFITHMHSLKYFRSVTHGLEVCLLMSDQPGAADVICKAQEIKMRPEKPELSGLMNPCRGAAVGMDYYHQGQTHTCTIT